MQKLNENKKRSFILGAMIFRNHPSLEINQKDKIIFSRYFIALIQG